MPNKVLVYTLYLVTLFFLPLASYDPFNPPKLFFLVGGLVTLFLFLFRRKHYFLRNPSKSILVLTSLFVCYSVFASLVNNSPFIEDFFGHPGRNVGLLTITAVFGFVIFSSMLNSIHLISKINSYFFVCGIIATSYGFLQLLDFDFFDWEGAEGGLLSLFGNQNIASAYFALFGIFIIWRLVEKRVPIIVFSFGVTLFILVCTAIFYTNSEQGFILLTIGAFALAFNYLFSVRNRLKLPFLLVASFVGALVIFDMSGKSPWSSFFYSWTLEQRIEYYKSALVLIKQYPLFGAGFGSFETFYKMNRSPDSINLPGFAAYTDTTHSIYLDLAVGGGLPLLLIFVCITLLTFLTCFRLLNIIPKEHPIIPICAAWLALQFHLAIAQSSITMYLLNFVFVGIILSASSFNLMPNKHSKTTSRTPKNRYTESKDIQELGDSALTNQDNGVGVIVVSLGYILGSILTIPLILLNGNLAQSIISGDVPKLIKLVDSYPKHSSRCSFIAETLVVNNLDAEANLVASKCVDFNPNQLVAWKILAKYLDKNGETNYRAIEEWKRLDPLDYAKSNEE